MRISDWSSDVCSSDLRRQRIGRAGKRFERIERRLGGARLGEGQRLDLEQQGRVGAVEHPALAERHPAHRVAVVAAFEHRDPAAWAISVEPEAERHLDRDRSEEHTSELQSLMRISYAVFCLKKKNKTHKYN